MQLLPTLEPTLGKEESLARVSLGRFTFWELTPLCVSSKGEYICGTLRLTALNPIGVLAHLILTTNLEKGCHHCLYITDKKTKAQRVKVAFPRKTAWKCQG